MLNELQNLQNYYTEEEEIDDNIEYEENNDENSFLNNDDKNIKVFCRFRPYNDIELSNTTNNSLIILSKEKLIFTQEKNLEIKKEYKFDGIFDINT